MRPKLFKSENFHHFYSALEEGTLTSSGEPFLKSDKKKGKDIDDIQLNVSIQRINLNQSLVPTMQLTSNHGHDSKF